MTTYNPNIKTTYTFIDEHGMAMVQNPSWTQDGDYGEGDSIGRTFHAYVAWKDPMFIEAVKKCYCYETDEKGLIRLRGYRHPNRIGNTYNDMSRDHTVNMLVFMKYVNDPFLNEMIKNLKWRISNRFTFTIDSWLWMKSLNGNKYKRFFWYLIMIPIQFFSILWNKIVWILGGFEDEVPEENFKLTPKELLGKREIFFRNLVYPYYALLLTGMQLHVQPNTWGKRMMQKICLWGTPKHNYVMKLLFGGKVTQEEVNNYKPMRSGRWSGILNKINDRDLCVITDSKLIEANVLDVDFLKALYEEIM